MDNKFEEMLGKQNDTVVEPSGAEASAAEAEKQAGVKTDIQQPESEASKETEPKMSKRESGLYGALKKEEKKNRELKQTIAETNERLARMEEHLTRNTASTTTKLPTTLQDLVDAGELDTDATLLTVEQHSRLEKNRETLKKEQEKTMVETRAPLQATQAQNAFRMSLPKEHIENGLDIDDVINTDSLKGLNGKDWDAFYALPVNSKERAEFLYKKCIERNPELQQLSTEVNTLYKVNNDNKKIKTTESNLPQKPAESGSKADDDFLTELTQQKKEYAKSRGW